MKKEKANAPAQKQSVNDFAHRLTIQLTEQHYVDYAMTHSQDQIQKGRKRAILWAVLFTILGLVAIYKGTFTEGWLSDIYLIAGILMIVFQIFNLFYNFRYNDFIIFSIVLFYIKIDILITIYDNKVQKKGVLYYLKDSF